MLLWPRRLRALWANCCLPCPPLRALQRRAWRCTRHPLIFMDCQHKMVLICDCCAKQSLHNGGWHWFTLMPRKPIPSAWYDPWAAFTGGGSGPWRRGAKCAKIFAASGLTASKVWKSPKTGSVLSQAKRSLIFCERLRVSSTLVGIGALTYPGQPIQETSHGQTPPF